MAEKGSAAGNAGREGPGSVGLDWAVFWPMNGPFGQWLPNRRSLGVKVKAAGEPVGDEDAIHRTPRRSGQIVEQAVDAVVAARPLASLQASLRCLVVSRSSWRLNSSRCPSSTRSSTSASTSAAANSSSGFVSRDFLSANSGSRGRTPPPVSRPSSGLAGASFRDRPQASPMIAREADVKLPWDGC